MPKPIPCVGFFYGFAPIHPLLILLTPNEMLLSVLHYTDLMVVDHIKKKITNNE